MKLLRITDTRINDNGQLEVKAISAKSTYTAEEYAPYGTDARPPKDTTALYSKTEADGDEGMVGFLIIGRKAEIGEHRIFSTDANKNFKFNIWLRADGTCLIGDSDDPEDYTNFAVYANELIEENNKLKSTVDDLVTKWNDFCSAYIPGSPTVQGTPPTLSNQTVTPNNSDFSLIKNEKIKIN